MKVLKICSVMALFTGIFVMFTGCASPFKKAMLAENLPHLKTAYNEAKPSKQLKYLSSSNIDGTSPLIYAVSKNNTDITKYLLEKGAGINVAVKSANYASTPLLAAITNGNAEMALFLVTKGADINYQGYGNVSPLALAISQGQRKVMEIMEGSGLLNKESYNGALYRIVISAESLAYKKEKIADYIKQGADINAYDGVSGNTPLMAAPDGNTDLMGYLITKGAAVNKANAKGITPLMTHSNNIGAVKFLVSKGADVKAVDGESNSLLMYAAAFNNVSVFNYYLSKGVNINYPNAAGQTVLMYSVEKGRGVEFMNLLVGNGADVHAQDKNRRTALNFAASANDLEAAKFLAACGADFQNPSLLYDSVRKDDGDAEMLSYMIRCGAGSRNMSSAERVSSEESKALLRAAQLHNFGAQKLLLRAGANPLVLSSDGRGLWHYAAEKYVYGQMDYLAKIIPHEMVLPDANGMTPLILAAKEDNLNAAEFLARAGAPILTKDKSGHDALYYAESGSELKKYLEKELEKQKTVQHKPIQKDRTAINN